MNGHQRQKEQSGRMIEDALFLLMEEKPYARITVSEITKKADVSRRTFYRLYHEKDEVLHCYFERLCREYSVKAPALKKYDISRVALDYFTFWYHYRDTLLLMHRCGLDEMLYYELSRASGTVVKARIGGGEWKNDREMDYFADYSTGGFSLLLQRWIAEGMEGSARQYAQAVSRALLKCIQSAASLRGGQQD